MKENIENKLSKLQVPNENLYKEEAFGKASGNIKIKGLIDFFEENEFFSRKEEFKGDMKKERS